MAERGRVKVSKAAAAQAEEIVDRWRVRENAGHHELQLFRDEQGWLAVGTISGASSMSAATLGDFVVQVLNERQQENRMLKEAVRAIKAAMKEGVTYATEMELDHAERGLSDRTARLRDVLKLLELVATHGVTEESQTAAQRIFDEFKVSNFSADQFW